MVGQVDKLQNGMRSGKVLSGAPGIVVLSPLLQVLHMNRQAQILISDLVLTAPAAQQPNHRPAGLPPVLINLSGEILRVLRSRHERSEKGLFEIRHVASNPGKQVLVRGIGASSANGLQDSRIVFVLDDMSATLVKTHQILSLAS